MNTCILSNSAILGEDREKEKTCWNGRATTTRTRTKKIIQGSRDHQPERELESREARRTEGTGRARTQRGSGVGKNTSILFDPILEKSLLMFMPPRKITYKLMYTLHLTIASIPVLMYPPMLIST